LWKTLALTNGGGKILKNILTEALLPGGWMGKEKYFVFRKEEPR